MQPRVKLRISKAAAALPWHARVPEIAPRARRGEEPAHEQREDRPPAAACSARRGGAGNARCRRGAARRQSGATCVLECALRDRGRGGERGGELAEGAAAFSYSRAGRGRARACARRGVEGREQGAEGGDGAAVWGAADHDGKLMESVRRMWGCAGEGVRRSVEGEVEVPHRRRGTARISGGQERSESETLQCWEGWNRMGAREDGRMSNLTLRMDPVTEEYV
ncbi:hypothetical protein BJ912DRAFT_923045 [Pholiota molesta]|nr:hypothetical protein BJ912DRAFT_923045 [Pholiota molesta]